MNRRYNEESTTLEATVRNDLMQRRDFFRLGISVAAAPAGLAGRAH